MVGGSVSASVLADFVLVDRSGLPARFYAHAGGRPTAVVFDGAGDDPRLVDLAGRLIARGDVALCCITSREPVGATDMPVWSDPEGTVAEAYGVAAGELTAVVLDPNLRVVGVAVGDHVADRVVALLDTAVHRDPAVQVMMQAPVMLLPRVLDAAYRERLIRVWEEEGRIETGVESSSGDVLDASLQAAPRSHCPRCRAAAGVVVGRRPPRHA